MPNKYAFLILVCLIIAIWPSPAQQEITIRIREGMPMIPLAVPEIQYQPASAQNEEVRQSIHDTLWKDLEFSRVFKLVPREHYSYIVRYNPASINFKDWASIQASVLVSQQLEITPEGRIILSVKAYDVSNEKMIFGRNFGTTKEHIRLIAHRVADEMMKLFGEKPLFTSKIVFVSGNGNSQEIYMMDYDGNRPIRLTQNTWIDTLASWSQDNEKILFTSYKRMSPDLYLLDIYTGKLSLISSGGSNYAADWAYNDDKIVYTSSKEGNHEIYLRNIRTGQEKRLTNTPYAIDTTPSFSPSGREIAFVSNRSGSPQIYIMDAEGANVRRITYEGSYHDSPSWSPDGTRIIFVSRIENRFDIYIYHLKSNQFTKLTENAGRNENPTWSPDGRHIAFASNRSGMYQVYLVDYDGRNIRQITFEDENRMPRWQKSAQ